MHSIVPRVRACKSSNNWVWKVLEELAKLKAYCCYAVPVAGQCYNVIDLFPQNTVAQSDSTSMAEGTTTTMPHVQSVTFRCKYRNLLMVCPGMKW